MGNNPSDLLHCSHLTRGPGSGLLSLLFWPLSMMLIVAPLRQRKVSFEPQIMFRYQVPDLPDFVDLAAPLPNDRSNHVVGDRHLMPGFWFSIQSYKKIGIFMKTNIFVHSKDNSDLRSRSLLSSLLDLPPPPPVDLRAKSAIASNGELRSRR